MTNFKKWALEKLPPDLFHGLTVGSCTYCPIENTCQYSNGRGNQYQCKDTFISWARQETPVDEKCAIITQANGKVIASITYDGKRGTEDLIDKDYKVYHCDKSNINFTQVEKSELYYFGEDANDNTNI